VNLLRHRHLLLLSSVLHWRANHEWRVTCQLHLILQDLLLVLLQGRRLVTVVVIGCVAGDELGARAVRTQAVRVLRLLLVQAATIAALPRGVVFGVLATASCGYVP
jgi:hypothetical protein